MKSSKLLKAVQTVNMLTVISSASCAIIALTQSTWSESMAWFCVFVYSLKDLILHINN